MLLHRVLDKNYRLQATPHAQQRSVHHTAQTPKTSKGKYRESTSPMSSPPVPAPELHSEIFSSPQRRPPRTPGVSVLTPAGKRANDLPKNTTKTGVWDSDSDSDEDEDGFLEGMSPPKTMQFHVPQSRLLQTPGMPLPPRSALNLPFHAFPYIHTYIHKTYIRTHTHTYIHTYIHTSLHTSIHTHTQLTLRSHLQSKQQANPNGTTAREASKRIVEDILRTAGGDNMTEESEDPDTSSPSVVRQNGNAEMEDSF